LRRRLSGIYGSVDSFCDSRIAHKNEKPRNGFAEDSGLYKTKTALGQQNERLQTACAGKARIKARTGEKGIFSAQVQFLGSF